MIIRVLTIRQPWAWLICEGLKDIENRDWLTYYSGELYIHASKTFDWNAFQWLAQRPFTLDAGRKAVEHFKIRFGRTPEDSVISAAFDELGAVVGCVDLVAGYGRSKSIWAQQDVKYHWTLAHAYHIKPIPARGKLNIWTMPMPPLIERLYFPEGSGKTRESDGMTNL